MPATIRARAVAKLAAISPLRRLRRRWRDASVRRKFLSVVFVSMLICLPPIVVAVVVQVRLREVRATTKIAEQTVLDITALGNTLVEADTAMRFFAVLNFDDLESVEAYQVAVDAVPDELAAVEQALPADFAGAMSEVEAATETLLDELAFVINYVPTIPTEGLTDEVVINERGPTLLEALLSATRATEAAHQSLEALEGVANRRLSADRAEVERIEGYLIWATLTSLAMAMLAVAGGAVVVTTGIVRRIELLSENGQRFLRGEPLLPREKSADEIGQLTDNITVMSEVLDARRQEAVAATRTKDEFLWRISHELRTPLTAIIGFGQLLEEEDLSAENLDSARHIVSAGHHLLALIDELLDVGRIEAGQLKVTVEPVAVEAVASQTISLVESMASARSLTLTSDCPEDLLVTADRRRLTQVLINLLSNAIKYNRPHGSVHLAATRQGDAVRISVTDTGPGISPADVDLLFRPYERLGAEGTGIEGSGIGLALTKRLIEAMNGTIGVDTEVDRGTTFWVDLPPATPVDERVTSLIAPAPASNPADHME